MKRWRRKAGPLILIHTTTNRRSGPGSAPGRRVITREEFDRMAAVIDECCAKLDLQFKRIAQIQAELDHARAAWKTHEPRTRQK